MGAEPFDPYTEAGRRILGTIADSPGSAGVPGAQPTRAVLAIHLLALIGREPTHCGHPAACIVSSGEGTTYCQWCEEVARLKSAFNAAVDYQETAEAALAESQALLALYSGGRAGVVPEGGWKHAADGGVPSLELDGPDHLTVEVERDGSWLVWRDLRYPDDAEILETHPGPRPILTACAEALAWLKAREADHV